MMSFIYDSDVFFFKALMSFIYDSDFLRIFMCKRNMS